MKYYGSSCSWRRNQLALAVTPSPRASMLDVVAPGLFQSSLMTRKLFSPNGLPHAQTQQSKEKNLFSSTCRKLARNPVGIPR